MKFKLIHTLKMRKFNGTKLGWSWKQSYEPNLGSVRMGVSLSGKITGWLNKCKSFPGREYLVSLKLLKSVF